MVRAEFRSSKRKPTGGFEERTTPAIGESFALRFLAVVAKKLIAKNIGATLNKLRIDKNLSMQQLATLAEIEKSQIYRIENGKVDVRISTLYLLADALKVDVKEFL